MTSTEDRRKKYLKAQEEHELKMLATNESLINDFKHFSKKRGVLLTDECFSYSPHLGILASFPNLIESLNLGFSIDKEGLVDIGALCSNYKKNIVTPGLLYGTNHILMAHPFFRRNLNKNSNWAPRFIELFWGINDEKLEVCIALDHNRVRINVDDSSYFEFDTWYGATFCNNIPSIKDGVVKLRPPSDIDEFENDFLFGNAYSLDILWKTKNGIKSFQAEEFMTENIMIRKNGADVYPVRYLHAEFDARNNYFRHLDGAVHFYTVDEYFERRDSDFNYNSKNLHQIKTMSEKLFKINGQVSIENFLTLTSHFLTGDPLIIEYFEGKYPAHVEETLTIIRRNRQNNSDTEH
jgi:hypothetical protein